MAIKRTFILAIFTFGLMLGSVSHAEIDNHSKQRHYGKMFKHLLEQLDLTDDQLDQIKTLRESGGPVMKALRATKKKAVIDLDNVLMREGGSESDLRVAFVNLQNAKAALESKRFDNMLAIRRLLNPQQQVKFYELSPKRYKKLRKRI